MAISQSERRRRRWRVLYAIYQITADNVDKHAYAQELAKGQQVPLDAVKAIGQELLEQKLVTARGEPHSDGLHLRITAEGKTVVERASLDADLAALVAPPGLTQIEHDANLVLRTLAEYGETDDDHERGYQDLDEIELQGLTSLQTHRLNDAVDRLDRRGLLEGTRILVGHRLNWKGALNDLGREAYQQVQLEARAGRPSVASGVYAENRRPTIFIAHGHDRQFTELELFLRRDRRFDVETFESGPRAG